VIELKSVSKSYNKNQVLCGVDFSISKGEHIFIHGASGIGKTTLLRLIAGFELPDAGDIKIDGRSVIKPYMPPYKRGVGFAFQGSALFPNMNVFKNIIFPIHRQNKNYIKERAEKLIDALSLTGLEKRNPSTLSGGQAKRVELARALAAKPKILLLDEPLSNIDLELQERILDFLLEDIQEFNAALIYVSHEKRESERIGGRTFVISDGRLEECGN